MKLAVIKKVDTALTKEMILKEYINLNDLVYTEKSILSSLFNIGGFLVYHKTDTQMLVKMTKFETKIEIFKRIFWINQKRSFEIYYPILPICNFRTHINISIRHIFQIFLCFLFQCLYLYSIMHTPE